MAEEPVTEEVTPVEEEAVTEAPTEEPAEVVVEEPVAEEPVVTTTKKRNQKIAEVTAKAEAEYQEALAALPETPRPISQMVVARGKRRP